MGKPAFLLALTVPAVSVAKALTAGGPVPQEPGVRWFSRDVSGNNCCPFRPPQNQTRDKVGFCLGGNQAKVLELMGLSFPWPLPTGPGGDALCSNRTRIDSLLCGPQELEEYYKSVSQPGSQSVGAWSLWGREAVWAWGWCCGAEATQAATGAAHMIL